MAFGLGSSVDSGTVGGAQFIISLAQMITDREAVAAQLRELAEALKKVAAARTELSRVEAQLLHRENQAAAAEAALDKRSADVAERERQAQFQLQRAEEAKAELKSTLSGIRQAA